MPSSLELLSGSGRSLMALLCVSLLAGRSSAGMVFLNGPAVQTSDLRRIDSYVSSTLPIYPKGFQLYNTGASGNRPIIIKAIDPERSGMPQPNPGYYTNLPAVIPQGFEGVATSSFVLGSPISVQSLPSSIRTAPSSAGTFLGSPVYQQQQEVAQSSVRVENSVEPIGRSLLSSENSNNNNNNNIAGTETPGPSSPNQPLRLIPNSVVQATSEYEATLPTELRNPFYSNQQTASSLAQESLPTSGEQVVETWDTKKIREGKIRELLSSAGLI